MWRRFFVVYGTLSHNCMIDGMKVEMPQQMVSVAAAGALLAVGIRLVKQPEVVVSDVVNKGRLINFEFERGADGKLTSRCLRRWRDYAFIENPLSVPERDYDMWGALALGR